MATLHLQDRRVDALKPRKSAFDVRDRDLNGLRRQGAPEGHVVLAFPDSRERQIDPSG